MGNPAELAATDPTRRTIVITGASDGIGAAAARALSAFGHRVVVVGRSPEKTAKVAADIGADHLLADFADLAQVRTLADQLLERYPQIDVLANNAGGVMGDRSETKDGHEKTFQVNHLAPFLLTTLLADRLTESSATVIATASAAHRFGKIELDDLESTHRYKAMRAYGSAKLANILTTVELQRRLGTGGSELPAGRPGLTAVSIHPGVVASQFAREGKALTRLFYRPPFDRFLVSTEQGADQIVWLAQGTPGVDFTPGTYYARRKPGSLSKQAKDATLARGLWDRSAKMLFG